MNISNCLHYHILDSVKPDLYSLLSQRNEPAVHSDKQLLSLIFKNYRFRQNLHHGLRLSYLGNRVVSKHFQSHSFQIEKRPTHQSLIILDKQMKWPYYISKSVAVFYSDNDAAWFNLNGSDLSQFTGYI